MTVEISSKLLAKMTDLAAAFYPREACGILVGQGERIERLIPAPNVHEQPERFFTIDPQTLIDAHRTMRGSESRVMGYFHSHPNGRAAPSAMDRKHATGRGDIWAIAARDRVTFWRDDEETFTALSITVLDV